MEEPVMLRHISRALIGLLALSLFGVIGCGDSSVEGSSAPQAQLAFVHSLQGLSDVSVLINGELFIELEAGELTTPKSLPPETVTIEIESAGRVLDSLTTSLDLKAQLYLVGLTGVIDQGTSSVWVVDQEPDPAEEGFHQLEVVNLRTDGIAFNVFAGTSPIAMSPEAKAVSDFVAIEAGDAVISLTLAESGAPVAIGEEQTFSDSGASMIIVSGDGPEDFTLQILDVR